MKNEETDKKRIEYLEEVVRLLLREKNQWQSKSNLLEEKLKNVIPPENISDLIEKNELAFLSRTGELLRPLIHDLKGQMAFLEMVINKTINNELLNPQIKENLKSVSIITKYLSRRITGISYLTGKNPDIFTTVDVNEILIENSEFIKSRYHNVKIELTLSEGQLNILGDKDSLNQIALNLMINAIEASEGSMSYLKITSNKTSDESYVAITVEDKGIGIYPGEIDRIFDLYYTTKKTGFGIGLYLVKRAVELHKGKIKCESQPGIGTIFTVSLPS